MSIIPIERRITNMARISMGAETKNSFIATDLEGTLTAAEGWKSIRRYFETHGRGRRFRQFFFSQLPRILLHRLGWLDTLTLRNQWMVDMAAVFKSCTQEELAGIGNWIIENEFWPQRRESVVAEIQQHLANGGYALIVSGLYEPILNSMAKRLGDERVEVLGTQLEFQNGKATGRCASEVCYGDIKAWRVKDRVGKGILVAAYGDTVGDVPMLAASQGPVAVCPDGDLRRVAIERGWQIMEEGT